MNICEGTIILPTTRNEEEAKNGFPQVQLWEWPCQHLAFRLLASDAVKGHISVALSHPSSKYLDLIAIETNVSTKADNVQLIVPNPTYLSHAFTQRT